MVISIDEYINKVRGCFMGKNIGGTLGAPFECMRGVLDLDFYSQDMSGGAWPNDDLDLQLAWLAAVKKHGKNVNSQILGEYWLSYIVANWSEYGAGKNNMRRGLQPPISGSYGNLNKNSCGAFIRSEIWACLMPGNPQMAVRYAFEDASVDHADEGIYGEIFFAAVQSAAFAQSDTYKLIDIGLSYIPKECGIATAINTAIECYKSGVDWKAARKKLMQVVPGTFGMYRGYELGGEEDDIPNGEVGYDAPGNVGITVMSWLYSEGDFEKAICIAAGCCEDADCTAATVGALLGIIMGEDKLPEKWVKPVGEGIKTVALNTIECFDPPKNITELTAEIAGMMPTFMTYKCDILSSQGVRINMLEPEDMCNERKVIRATRYSYTFLDYIKDHDKSLYRENSILRAKVTLCDGIELQEGKESKVKIELENLLFRQQWIDIIWHMPSEWNVAQGKKQTVLLEYFAAHGIIEFETAVTPNMLEESEYDTVLELVSHGRISNMYIPIKFVRSPKFVNCYKAVE